MYKRVAILSDNGFLAKKFVNLIGSYRDRLELVSIFISPYSSIDDFDIEGVGVVDVKNETDEAYLIQTYDLIFSIHSKQIFPKRLVEGVKCINVHPGYNPNNRGWYPQVFAIIEDRVIGATIHEIDTELDHGPIIARELVTKDVTDSSLSLYNKVVKMELKLLKDYLSDILNGSYRTVSPEGEGHLHLKADFNKLCKIDLSKKATYGEVIDHLRALNHGDYNNAYFYDENGNKVFLKLHLNRD